MSFLKKPAKIILYRLFKKTNQKIHQIHSQVNGGNPGKDKRYITKNILIGLKKKGLVNMSEYPDGNIYYLTEKGRKFAKPIVDEVDEYKRW